MNLENLNIVDIINKAFTEAVRERGHVNVLIAGRTGVGKGTLINAVFQGNYATTGQGRPVTQETREIKKQGIPLSIFDTRGLEMADYQETLDALHTLILERQQDTDPNKHIHIAWLLIQEPGRRVEPAEIALHEMFHNAGLPVIGVITKAISDGGFRAEVQRLLPQTRGVQRVNSLEMVMDGGFSVPAHGLDELVDLTMECVPLGHQRAFAAAQKASIAQKVKHSRIVVNAAAATAAGIGAQPIPFADAFLLVPTQVGMITGITATFGMELTEGFISALVASAAGATAATYAGRALVGNLIQMFPGVGSAVGGAINAVTASTLTMALGEAYIQTLKLLFEEHGGEPPTPAEVAERFKAILDEK